MMHRHIVTSLSSRSSVSLAFALVIIINNILCYYYTFLLMLNLSIIKHFNFTLISIWWMITIWHGFALKNPTHMHKSWQFFYYCGVATWIPHTVHTTISSDAAAVRIKIKWDSVFYDDHYDNNGLTKNKSEVRVRERLRLWEKKTYNNQQYQRNMSCLSACLYVFFLLLFERHLILITKLWGDWGEWGGVGV